MNITVRELIDIIEASVETIEITVANNSCGTTTQLTKEVLVEIINPATLIGYLKDMVN